MVGGPFELVQSVKLDPEVGAVVVAFDCHISLPKILKASSYVNAVPDCLFLASNTDECFPVQGTDLTYPGELSARSTDSCLCISTFPCHNNGMFVDLVLG